MTITVNIESTAGGFIATAGPPLNATGEGATLSEALIRLGQQTNAEETKLSVEAEPHPLMKWAGSWIDDELSAEYEKEIAAFRLERDLREQELLRNADAAD